MSPMTVEHTDHVEQMAEVAERLETAPPQDILQHALDAHSGVAMACSFGVQSVAMIDMLAQMGRIKDVSVFYLDTGVLFPQTHQTRLKVQSRYGFRAVRLSPRLSWEEQQAKFGGHLYEQGAEGIAQCCQMRKVVPLRDFLADKPAWITGMRRSHSKTRADVPVALWDAVNDAAKFNPMATIDDATVWGYVKANAVPYNPLYDQGYPSIGCQTSVCTRPVKDGEDPRSGRWGGAKAECGIHLDGNQIKSLGSSQL